MASIATSAATARTSAAHGTSPAWFTPRWAVALDVDDTVRDPGRIR